MDDVIPGPGPPVVLTKRVFGGNEISDAGTVGYILKDLLFNIG